MEFSSLWTLEFSLVVPIELRFDLLHFNCKLCCIVTHTKKRKDVRTCHIWSCHVDTQAMC